MDKEGIEKTTQKILSIEGSPEVIVKELDEVYLRTLFESIVYKDVVKRWNVRYPTLIEDLAKYLISNYSSEFTYTKIRRILNLRGTLTVPKIYRLYRGCLSNLPA